MKKIRIGWMALETGITSVIALILLWILSTIITAITPSFGSMAAVLMTIASAILLMIAIYMRPGDENFVETIPVIIITLTLLTLFKTWIPSLPNLAIDFNWTSLAFGLSSVYFADVLTQKIAKWW